MLKDFLIDNDSINSCSSSGFESFPRRRSSIRSLIQNDVSDVASNSSNKASLLRSRSRAAASTTISAFLAIISTIKTIQLNNVVKVKPPSILPRISLSRKLSSKKKSTPTRKEIINDIKITVRVRDIIRWKSFRDLAMDDKPQPQPSDLASSPDHQCTTTTTTIGSTTNSTPSPCSSNGSSWCESDFTSDYYYLPPWTGNSAENDARGKVGEKYSPRVGSDCDSMKATIESAEGPEELHGEEKEQLSPVSVLDFELQEDDEDHSVSSFDQSLANLEKWMSMEENDGDDSSAEEEEEEEEEEINIEVEEKAKLLLNKIKSTISPTWNCEDSRIVSEQLLLDFLVEELSAKRNNQGRINEIVRQAEAWIKGEDSATTLLIDDAGDCIRDMDRKESWNKFEGEQEEVSMQIENTLLNLLLDDLLLDL